MFEPLGISFSHFLVSIFLVHIRQYFDDKVQNGSHNQDSHTHDDNVKLRVVADWFIIFTIINKAISSPLIVLFSKFVISPIALFDVFDESGNPLTKSLGDFSHASPSTTSCAISFSTRDNKKEKIDQKSLYKHK